MNVLQCTDENVDFLFGRNIPKGKLFAQSETLIGFDEAVSFAF